MNFHVFWSLYPRKVAKVAAEKAAKKILDTEWPLVIEGLVKYKKIWTDKQYIPHASTFLNNRRWEDEIETIEEVKQTTAASIFVHSVKTHKSFPGKELPNDIVATFYKMGIHWEFLKKMSDEQITEKFNSHYGDKPNPVSNVIDFKSRAAGET